MSFPSPPSHSILPSISSTASFRDLPQPSASTPSLTHHSHTTPPSKPPTAPLPSLPIKPALPKLPEHPLRMNPVSSGPGAPPTSPLTSTTDPIKGAAPVTWHRARASSPTLPFATPDVTPPLPTLPRGQYEDVEESATYAFDPRFNYTTAERAVRIAEIEAAKGAWDGFMRRSLRVTEERAGDAYEADGRWIGRTVATGGTEGRERGDGKEVTMTVSVNKGELEALRAEVARITGRLGARENRAEVERELEAIADALEKLLAG